MSALMQTLKETKAIEVVRVDRAALGFTVFDLVQPVVDVVAPNRAEGVSLDRYKQAFGTGIADHNAAIYAPLATLQALLFSSARRSCAAALPTSTSVPSICR